MRQRRRQPWTASRGLAGLAISLSGSGCMLTVRKLGWGTCALCCVTVILLHNTSSQVALADTACQAHFSPRPPGPTSPRPYDLQSL